MQTNSDFERYINLIASWDKLESFSASHSVSQTQVNICTDVKFCNFCGNNRFELIEKLNGYEWEYVKKYYKENSEVNPFEDLPEFYIKKCVSCGLVHATPRISNYIAYRFYNEYFNGKFDGYIKGYSNDFREEIFSKYYNCISEYIFSSSSKKEKKILDVGCASGRLLKIFKENNYVCYGIDVADIICEANKYGTVYKLDVLVGMGKFEENELDIITFVDSLEHFTNPCAVLYESYKLLNNNGILFLEVPNFNSGYGRMSRHYYLFTTKTIKQIFEKIGFQILYNEEVSELYNPHDKTVLKRFVRTIARKI